MHPNTAKKINAKWLEPVKLATYVMTNGGKNPPKPPIIDTIPFADPASFEKYDGTNLKLSRYQYLHKYLLLNNLQ